jgi:hypothetical protein
MKNLLILATLVMMSCDDSRSIESDCDLLFEQNLECVDYVLPDNEIRNEWIEQCENSYDMRNDEQWGAITDCYYLPCLDRDVCFQNCGL